MNVTNAKPAAPLSAKQETAIDSPYLADRNPSLSVVVTEDETAAPSKAPFVPPRRSEELRYDPDTIAAYYSQRPFRAWTRALGIFLPFIFFGLRLWWNRFTGNVEGDQQGQAIHLREMLTRLGPAFIKVGQALSTRPDLVPPVYLDELTKLQDQLPPFPNEIAFQFIQEELGDRPDVIYAELSELPIAAASLGQVYKGKLKTGETVAVKVQRPGLAQSITLDMYILRGLANWAMQNIKRVKSDLVAITDELATRIFEEMDYTQEGHNAERFAELYGHLPEIYVPCIYWQYTGRRVLTMEWITGTKLTQLEEIKAQGIDATHLIDLGVQCSLRQLLESGFFHADPHPGNLLAMADGKLAYLDFGMMSEIQPYQRYGLIEAIVHLVNRDFEGLANDYVNLGFLSPTIDLAPIIPALSEVFNDALGASVAEINIKSITDKLSGLMYDYPFQVPAFFALIIRSLVTLEGIAIRVDPDFKVLSKAYPYVAKRLLTDSAPELRSSLSDLLFKEGSFRWNRLENLLKNARNNQDYNLDLAIDQAADFLFSERGEFIRANLVNEIIKGLDILGQTVWHNLTYGLRERVGLTVDRSTFPNENQQTLDHVRRIWNILRETRGFDQNKLFVILPRLLARPETQQMGQQVVGGLAQRVAVRLLREFLLASQPHPNTTTSNVPLTPSRPALPAARGD
ncbi:MAG: AarF/ABC1/UbiB kinase family protein [Leptolyngbyaceae cyanobacterium CSU_1_3]|nr:AarF/ABC1/UbiB kinase family protein [Leptolyngbyaceae cyanobacterium CSU_1_3]